MAIAFRSIGTGATGDGVATITPGAPAGRLATDVLVAVLGFGGGTGVTITPPSGWTLISRTNSTTVHGSAAYWALGNVASFAFGLSGLVGTAAAIAAAYSGADNSTPMDAAGVGQVNASSGTVTAPSITTVTANTQLVVFGQTFDAGAANTGTWTAVFGALRGSVGLRGATNTVSVAIADGAQVAAGASGTKTETYSVALPNVGTLAALRLPAAASYAVARAFGPMRRPGSVGDALTRFRSPGAFPPTSTVQNLLQSLAGTLTSSGAILKQANTSKAGTLTDSGALLKQPATSKAGTLTDSGALLKQPQKPLAGTLTSSATLAAIKIVLLALAGTLTSSGTLLKQALKPLAGTMASSGALLKQAIKAFAGALASSGSILKRALKPLAGTLSSSATLTAIKIVLKSLAGALASSGALVKMTGKTTAGSLTSSGALSKVASHILVGTLSFLGALTGVPVVAPRPDGTERFLAWLQLRAGFHRGRR